MNSPLDALAGRALPPVRAAVLGASVGGLAALGEIVLDLPSGFGLPLVVVQHLPPRQPSDLVRVFEAKTALRVSEAVAKEPLRPGHLYFAPPDYHLLIEDDASFALSLDEPVNYSRPSIDVLFESAAWALGTQVVGILLSGASEDGAAGLQAIHRAGGLSVVQAPAEAAMDTMPRAALARFTPDFVLPVREVRRLLCRLEGCDE